MRLDAPSLINAIPALHWLGGFRPPVAATGWKSARHGPVKAGSPQRSLRHQVELLTLTVGPGSTVLRSASFAAVAPPASLYGLAAGNASAGCELGDVGFEVPFPVRWERLSLRCDAGVAGGGFDELYVTPVADRRVLGVEEPFQLPWADAGALSELAEWCAAEARVGCGGRWRRASTP